MTPSYPRLRQACTSALTAFTISMLITVAFAVYNIGPALVFWIMGTAVMHCVGG